MSGPRVAMVTCLNHREEFAAAYDVHLRTWRSIDPSTTLSVDEPVSIRPVVVIDPEDWDQVDALAEALCLHRFTDDAANDAVQAALRSRAAPPNPAEPAGLGAVVKDSIGREWVRAERVALADMHWRHTDESGKATCAKWSGINVVEVSSDGVPA